MAENVGTETPARTKPMQISAFAHAWLSLKREEMKREGQNTTMIELFDELVKVKATPAEAAKAHARAMKENGECDA